MWINVDDVKQFTGVKPQHLKLANDDINKLDEILADWICQSMDLIKSYTHNKFKTEVPGAVKNICLRLTSNMIQLAIERRDTPRTIVSDWQIKVSSSEIFTSDLKEDLEPFKIEHSNKSDTVTFFAIHGGDE